MSDSRTKDLVCTCKAEHWQWHNDTCPRASIENKRGEAPSSKQNNDPTGWREFIENVIEGKNYFRTSEYMKLLEQFETVTRERDDALSKLNADETSGQRAPMHVAGERFVQKFKREPTSPSDAAWLNGFVEAHSPEEPEAHICWACQAVYTGPRGADGRGPCCRPAEEPEATPAAQIGARIPYDIGLRGADESEACGVVPPPLKANCKYCDNGSVVTADGFHKITVRCTEYPNENVVPNAFGEVPGETDLSHLDAGVAEASAYQCPVTKVDCIRNCAPQRCAIAQTT